MTNFTGRSYFNIFYKMNLKTVIFFCGRLTSLYLTHLLIEYVAYVADITRNHRTGSAGSEKSFNYFQGTARDPHPDQAKKMNFFLLGCWSVCGSHQMNFFSSLFFDPPTLAVNTPNLLVQIVYICHFITVYPHLLTY